MEGFPNGDEHEQLAAFEAEVDQTLGRLRGIKADNAALVGEIEELIEGVCAGREEAARQAPALLARLAMVQVRAAQAEDGAETSAPDAESADAMERETEALRQRLAAEEEEARALEAELALLAAKADDDDAVEAAMQADISALQAAAAHQNAATQAAHSKAAALGADRDMQDWWAGGGAGIGGGVWVAASAPATNRRMRPGVGLPRSLCPRMHRRGIVHPCLPRTMPMQATCFPPIHAHTRHMTHYTSAPPSPHPTSTHPCPACNRCAAAAEACAAFTGVRILRFTSTGLVLGLRVAYPTVGVPPGGPSVLAALPCTETLTEAEVMLRQPPQTPALVQAVRLDTAAADVVLPDLAGSKLPDAVRGLGRLLGCVHACLVFVAPHRKQHRPRRLAPASAPAHPDTQHAPRAPGCRWKRSCGPSRAIGTGRRCLPAARQHPPWTPRCTTSGCA